MPTPGITPAAAMRHGRPMTRRRHATGIFTRTITAIATLGGGGLGDGEEVGRS